MYPDDLIFISVVLFLFMHYLMETTALFTLSGIALQSQTLPEIITVLPFAGSVLQKLAFLETMTLLTCLGAALLNHAFKKIKNQGQHY